MNRLTHPRVDAADAACLPEDVQMVTRRADLCALSAMLRTVHRLVPKSDLGKDALVLAQQLDGFARPADQQERIAS